jgi:hypothetical protein
MLTTGVPSEAPRPRDSPQRRVAACPVPLQPVGAQCMDRVLISSARLPFPAGDGSSAMARARVCVCERERERERGKEEGKDTHARTYTQRERQSRERVPGRIRKAEKASPSANEYVLTEERQVTL